MTSTFVNDLRLNEQGTGDNSGSWGTVTNTNLELIGEALGFGEQQVFPQDQNADTTIADGASDPARAMYFRVTSAGNLTATRQMTIIPNTTSRLMFIENATSGSQSILVKCGSDSAGDKVTIPTGLTKVVYLTGAGGSGTVVDAFAALSVDDLLVDDDLTVTDDLVVGGLATIGETLAVTGVLTTTAATVFNGGFASNADSTITVDDNGYNLTLISTDTDENSGPRLKFFRNSANPAADDFIGLIDFTGEDAGGNETRYANIVAQIASPVAGGEGGKLILEVATHDGEMQTGFEIIDGNAEDELDVNIGSGTSSVTTIAGTLTSTGTVGVRAAAASAVALTVKSTGNTASALVVQQTGNTDGWGLTPDNTNGNLDFVRIGGGAGTYFRIGVDGSVSTPTLGSNNVRLGENAGNTIASGGNSNVCIGVNAGTAITTGDNNVAVGFDALTLEDGNGFNVAIGHSALKTLNAGASGFNTAVGHEAGTLIDLGIHNTLIGGRAGDKLAHSDFNVAVGVNALGADTLGFGSVAIGVSALQTMDFTSSTETRCTAVGYQAGKLNQTGTDNTLIGAQCGDAITTGFQNTGVGHDALGASDDGQNNVAVGFLALNGNCGDNNTAVGESALAVSTGTNNQCFGNSAGAAITGGNYNTIVGNHTGNGDSVDIRGADNNLIIADGQGNVRISYRSDGNTFQIPDLYSNTSSGSANMVALASGTIARATSSLRYKKDVADATHGLSEVLNLRPVTYKGKGGEDGDTVYGGLIAEEVHAAGLTEFVEYDTQNRPDALHYSNMVSLCIKAIQEQQATITALTDRIAVLEG